MQRTAPVEVYVPALRSSCPPNSPIPQLRYCPSRSIAGALRQRWAQLPAHTMSTTTTTTPDLKSRLAALKAAQPHTYLRNAAAELGVSEVELLATRLGEGVTRLHDDPKAILADVPTLGRVMALTRNNDVVHERKGTYANPTLEGHVGLFVGADIDLRIFWSHWASAFAVEEEGRDGLRRSLQFFSPTGVAVHKIYLGEASDQAAYQALVAKHSAADQTPPKVTLTAAAPRPEMPDAAVDVAGLRAGWLALQDTHDFYLLLRDFRVSRTQALRLAPEGGYAVPVAPAALRATLNAVAAQQVPIMIFVGNPGMIQIHSGPITNVVDARGWLNVLDPELNVHIREEAIATAWVVRKPTADGMVTALECYDAAGEQIIQLFGARKPGIPELEAWRAVVATVEAEQRP